MKKYYCLGQSGKTAEVVIYGVITSHRWDESDVTSFSLAQEIAGLDVDEIHVYINSPGGVVSEALAIRTQLKRHKAQIITHCDGFACSAASVIFSAGDRRIMGDASLLMIHNAWTCTQGDAEELRKQADDLEKINQASITAYMDCVNISEEEIKQYMNKETWLSPEEAVQIGLATEIEKKEKDAGATQSVNEAIVKKLLGCAKDPAALPVDAEQLAELILTKMEKRVMQRREEEGEPESAKCDFVQLLGALAR